MHPLFFSLSGKKNCVLFNSYQAILLSLIGVKNEQNLVGRQMMTASNNRPPGKKYWMGSLQPYKTDYEFLGHHSDDPPLTRKQASHYIRQQVQANGMYYKMSYTTLHKLACIGGGPVYEINAKGFAVYKKSALDAWLTTKAPRKGRSDKGQKRKPTKSIGGLSDTSYQCETDAASVTDHIKDHE